MIYQTSTYTYSAAQVISQYLKPLCKNVKLIYLKLTISGFNLTGRDS